ncbi:hypothetical protein G3V96_28945, partial [Escherichia coli]|nr:hypothetical protein [Escherichia coli]
QREKGNEAHIAQAQEDHGDALLNISLVDVTDDSPPEDLSPAPVMHGTVNAGVEYVFLNEERVIPTPTDGKRWFFDSGASNHMTGCREMLSDLDETVRGTVKIGDGSLVEIRGRGVVLFTGTGGEHRALTSVYYIPRLHTHIVSLGQLDEV